MLKDIHTYAELQDYLIKRSHLASDDKSNSSLSFSKKTVWWYWMNTCFENYNKFIPLSDVLKIREVMLKDFPNE